MDFKYSGAHGWYSCPWIYVNIENHSHCAGMPGVGITQPLNDHAVTIPEFYKIFEEYNKNPLNFDSSEIVKSIYSKYKGKEVFVFKKKRFDADESK